MSDDPVTLLAEVSELLAQSAQAASDATTAAHRARMLVGFASVKAERLRRTLVGYHAERVVDLGKMPLELDVHDGPDDLHDLPDLGPGLRVESIGAMPPTSTSRCAGSAITSSGFR